MAEKENAQKVIDSEIDVDKISKRRLLKEYLAMRRGLSTVIIRLFFYAPEDRYFDQFSSSEKEELRSAAFVMFSEEEKNIEKVKQDLKKES